MVPFNRESPVWSSSSEVDRGRRRGRERAERGGVYLHHANVAGIGQLPPIPVRTLCARRQALRKASFPAVGDHFCKKEFATLPRSCRSAGLSVPAPHTARFLLLLLLVLLLLLLLLLKNFSFLFSLLQTLHGLPLCSRHRDS